MRGLLEAIAADAVDPLGEHDEPSGRQKPRLLVDNSNPDHTVAALRDTLSDAGEFYDRGVPVRVAHDQVRQGAVAHTVTPDLLAFRIHAYCRPYALKMKDGRLEEVDVGMPQKFARMYLDWRGEWQLPPLNGISTSPLLGEDGAIRAANGYDATSGLWCENVPNISALVPPRPTKEEAAAAVALVRRTFKTFPFADAKMVIDATTGVAMVDTRSPPGADETSFLAGLLTAACRASLYLAPGFLLRAPAISGAGAGKGLLARCMCLIAHGQAPHAVTAGETLEELEKRIGAELIAGSPALFLDNLNNRAVKSDLLASAITERPARVRVLGQSKMLLLNSTAFIVITGNGLTVSEDLARRFLPVELDARMEDPETRQFSIDILAEVKSRRLELLAALLTIWRWGRHVVELPAGKPFGSFEQWARWVRDPLLALGCRDPVERVADAKQADGRRQTLRELFGCWWKHHGSDLVAVSELHDEVVHIADPRGRGRQYLAAQIQKLDGTRLDGYVLSRHKSDSRWTAAEYSLLSTRPENHRDHREHGTGHDPMTPMTPMIPGPSSGWRGRI